MNFVNPSDQTIRVGPLIIRFLVTAKDSGGSVAAFEYTVPAGERLPVPAHSHDGYEETSYGVEGTLRFIVEGREFEVGPGQAVCIPRGAVHRFENPGDRDAKGLAVITPGVLGPEYFRETAEALRAAAGGPPDRVLLGQIMRRHGLTPAPTPG